MGGKEGAKDQEKYRGSRQYVKIFPDLEGFYDRVNRIITRSESTLS